MTLLDEAKIITTATGSKAGTLYSIKPDTGAADFTITRSSTATKINSSGIIETVAVNAPQLDYTDSTCPGFLVEPQRTNLFTYSTGLPTGGWSGGGIVWNTNTVVAPDGTTTGNLVEDNGSGSGYAYNNITVAASTTYTFSFYAKRGSATQMKFYAIDSATGASFIPQTDFYPLTNSSTWTRVNATFTTGGSTTTARIYFRYITAGGTFSLWGLQLEQYSITTSYIPTSGASVTRVGTVWNTSGLSSIVNPLEGVFMAEIRFTSVPRNGVSMISLSSGSTSNMVNIGYWGGFFGQVTFNGSHLLFGLGTQPTFDNNFHKIAIKYKSGDCAIWFDGVETTSTTTTGAPTGTNLNMISGTYGNSNGFWPFFGDIRQLQVYDTILTDAQLLALTT